MYGSILDSMKDEKDLNVTITDTLSLSKCCMRGKQNTGTDQVYFRTNGLGIIPGIMKDMSAQTLNTVPKPGHLDIDINLLEKVKR